MMNEVSDVNTKRFAYKSMDDLQSALKDLRVELPLDDDVKILSESISVKGRKIANRIAVQPMEGADGNLDGTPGELTKRRYERFAKGGSGLIWFEAVAVQHEGRANPRQLMLDEKNADKFREIVENIKEICIKTNGFEPVVIMQLTHSGRQSRPDGTPRPVIACNKPLFEKDESISQESIISDDELKRLEIKMGNAARIAESIGFDGVDIKACHGYLNNELLSAYQRKGEYGGSFENRIRFMVNSVANAMANTSSEFIVTSRLNVYDGFPYPHGFGVNERDGLEPDMTEPLKLIDILHNKMGMGMIDITIGNPYVNPHVNRPSDFTAYECSEHPLKGVERLVNCAKAVQRQFKDLVVIGSGLTYLRQFSPHLAAGAIKNRYFSIAGFGRMSFAYPNFANDILKNGYLAPEKCCITCGKCTQLMRTSGNAGCVIRDGIYAEFFKALKLAVK